MANHFHNSSMPYRFNHHQENFLVTSIHICDLTELARRCECIHTPEPLHDHPLSVQECILEDVNICMTFNPYPQIKTSIMYTYHPIQLQSRNFLEYNTEPVICILSQSKILYVPT